jgi:hypothetical protein
LAALSSLPSGLHAQGTIVFNNSANTDASPTAKSNGLAFLLNSPLAQDVNFQLYAGSSQPTESLIHSWLITDGTAKGIVTSPGHFSDPAGSVFLIPGVASGQPAVVLIAAWTGNYPSFLSAEEAGAEFGVASFQYTAGGSGVPAQSLLNMPALDLAAIPEPSPTALAIVGCLLVALKRRSYAAL